MRRFPIELLCWTGALIYLACVRPDAAHSSWCLFQRLGFNWCPGCGIGHAISHALHGNWSASWQSHMLGLPAVAILSHRITVLVAQVNRRRTTRQHLPPSNLSA